MIFREITIKPSCKGSYRASTLATWYWCAEQCYWKCQGIEPEGVAVERMVAGTLVHELIHKEAKHWGWEEKFYQELDKRRKDGYGFIREVKGDKIYEDVTGHPDEFQVTVGKKVSIIELKTTSITNKDFYLRYKFPTAQFQTQIYCYILEPILQEMGYTLDRIHAVSVYNVELKDKELQSYRHWLDIPVFYYKTDIENTLVTILKALRTYKGIIPPQGVPKCFKCKMCPKVYKERCQWVKNASSATVQLKDGCAESVCKTNMTEDLEME